MQHLSKYCLLFFINLGFIQPSHLLGQEHLLIIKSNGIVETVVCPDPGYPVLLDHLFLEYQGQDILDYRWEAGNLYINGHLKGLLVKSENDLSGDLSNIENIYLRTRITPAIIDRLKTCPSPLYVELSVYNTDEDVKYLAGLKNLRALNCDPSTVMETSMISGEGLKYLKGNNNLVALRLKKTLIQDKDMNYLLDMKNLMILDVGYSDISDEGMEIISRMKNLHTLGFHYCLRFLAKTRMDILLDMPHLRQLDGGEGSISYQSLPHIGSLNQLNTLNLSRSGPISTRLSDKGIKFLKNLTNMNYLDLFDTKMSDTGLKYIQDFKNLYYLYIGGNLITSQGLKVLTGFKSLRYLDISDSILITDEGIPYLRQLKNLVFLRLYTTGISDNGIEELKRALPQCRIEYF